jgi:hypothetical protein
MAFIQIICSIKFKSISYYNITGSSNIRNWSPCLIFINIYCSVKYVVIAKFTSDGGSYVNEFRVNMIDVLQSLNVEAAESHFKFESSIYLVM